jgi:urease accessory protein
MGALATRITSEEFVTPPEFSAWKLAANPAGRIGGVRLRLNADDSQTRLVEAYQQIPLRVLPPFQGLADEPALVYLLNPTAGLMDGDAHLVEVIAECGTRAVLTGQSATRIHPCLQGFATQQWHIKVGPGAILVVLPGPAIPFRGCRYYQRAVIELAGDAGLVWWDIWFAGRYARGTLTEQFHFSNLIQDLTVRRDGRLIFRDRFSWRGPWDKESAAWHFGDSPACGSLFVSGKPRSEVLDGSTACAHAEFTTAAGDTCLRWHGTSEAVVRNVAVSALRAGAQLANADAPLPWLLETGRLGPNHWFSSAHSDRNA